MTHSEKIIYMRIAASIANFGFKEEQLDLLVSLYELVLQKKGKGSIDDVVAIEHLVKFRQETREKELLQKKVDEVIPPEEEKGITLVSYRKYEGSNAKSTTFHKRKDKLGIEEIETTLAQLVGVPKVYHWWYGTITQEPIPKS